MIDDDVVTNTAASQPALLEYFGIDGLFGYRSVSLSSKYAATVVIAKNGAGKTTLLGAMDAFLKGQFFRLTELQFTKIECKLRGVDLALVLHKSDLNEIKELSASEELLRSATLHELDPAALLAFVLNDYPLLKADSRELGDHPIYQKMLRQYGYASNRVRLVLDQLESNVENVNPRISAIRKSLRSVLGDVEIVYLPTYRRIELSLPETDDSKTGKRSPSIQSRLGINRRGLHVGDIQFGLSDISERLARLNQEVLFESNQGYREVSANIINDLLSGVFEGQIPSNEETPTKDALSLFFARLKDVRRMMPFPDVQVPDLDRIYSDEQIPESSRKFLTYFLGKLNTVMQKTRDAEAMVQEFVSNCNRYLSTQDDSTDIPNRGVPEQTQQDNKALTLDRRTLAVAVSSVTTKRKIPLDSLSSGEKQMISLFARLYLYPKRKLVLVDEPELSLSIDWQRRILVDIVNAGLCEQVVAITHSPFVFDNALEPFATPLRLRIDHSAQSPDSSEDRDETHG